VISSHEKFNNSNKLPFVLLSDEDKKIQKLWSTTLFGILPGESDVSLTKELYHGFNIMAANHIRKH
jgi:hypothetical protein